MFGVKEVVYHYSADLANAFYFHVCFMYLDGIVIGYSNLIKKKTFFMFGKNCLQEQKRREMILARELKKPVEDMVLKDSKVKIC